MIAVLQRDCQGQENEMCYKKMCYKKEEGKGEQHAALTKKGRQAVLRTNTLYTAACLTHFLCKPLSHTLQLYTHYSSYIPYVANQKLLMSIDSKMPLNC